MAWWCASNTRQSDCVDRRKGAIMCGIVGYTGESAAAAPILLDGLAKLEYRGYDSAGIAVMEGDALQVVRRRGKVAELAHTAAIST